MTGKKKSVVKAPPQSKDSVAAIPSIQPVARVPSDQPLPAAPVPSDSDQTEDSRLWQQAHDALQAAFEQGNSSLDKTEGTPRKKLNDLLDTLSDEITALNQEDLKKHTVSLQAANQQLGAGTAKLQTLRDDIDDISDSIADAAKVVTAINDALSGITAFLATFPAI